MYLQYNLLSSSPYPSINFNLVVYIHYFPRHEFISYRIYRSKILIPRSFIDAISFFDD